MTVYQIIAFILLGLGIIATALVMLISRKMVHAVLALVLNFVLVAVIYIMLGAPFVALAQITVYAGSIMVLFLFVVMLLGPDHLPLRQEIAGQKPLTLMLGAVFLAEMMVFLVWKVNAVQPILTPALDFATPVKVGQLLFTEYAFPVILISVLLLAAVVGAIILTRSDKDPASRES